MDIREIQNLIKFVAKSGATEVKLEMDDFKITIKTTPEGAETTYIPQMPMTTAMPMMAQPVATQPVHVAAVAAPAAEENQNLIVVKSPMIGTFYRKPSPDKSSFVEVGDTIKNGDVLCVIEAMKLFNEIEAEVSGKIVKVLVEDASPVEFDQPLFLVDPS
jgi:acetyl-CoA carboxylase biotin carboxyl carrier protein